MAKPTERLLARAAIMPAFDAEAGGGKRRDYGVDDALSDLDPR